MDSSALLLTGWSSLCQRPSCTLLFTAFMKLKLLYTLSEFVSRVFYSKGKKGVRLGSGSKDPMEPAGGKGRICLPWQQKDASYAPLHFIAMPSRSPQELLHAASSISFL